MNRFCKVSGAAMTMLVAACGRDPTPAAERPDAGRTLQTGVASFYGREFTGRETASGERLNPRAMTAASRTLPIGTRVEVVNAETGQSAKVRINDRGPYAKGRVLDLTPKAAQHIGIDEEDGVAQVSIKSVHPFTEATSRSMGQTRRR